MAEVIDVARNIDDLLGLIAEWRKKFAEAELHDEDCSLSAEVYLVDVSHARLLDEMMTRLMPGHCYPSIRLTHDIMMGQETVTCTLFAEYQSQHHSE